MLKFGRLKFYASTSDNGRDPRVDCACVIRVVLYCIVMGGASLNVLSGLYQLGNLEIFNRRSLFM